MRGVLAGPGGLLYRFGLIFTHFGSFSVTTVNKSSIFMSFSLFRGFNVLDYDS